MRHRQRSLCLFEFYTARRSGRKTCSGLVERYVCSRGRSPTRGRPYSGRRGRRLPVAIVLRFDRVGRREPSPTSPTLALLARILYGSAVMFVKLARGWWSDTLPLPKKFRVQPSFFGNPIFFIHSVSIPHSALI